MPRKSAPKNSKRFEKSVKAIVQEELKDEIEEKHALLDYTNIAINAAIPGGTVFSGAGNFFKLLPDIQQSEVGEAGKAYNTRIGNEINLKSIDILGMLNYRFATATETEYKNAKLAVRIMILRAKQINDNELLFDDMPTDTLIRFGTDGVGAGPTSFNGNPTDPFRSINRDTFAVRYDKVHYIDAPVLLRGTASVEDIPLVPSRSKMFKHKLTFGNGLKLKYSSNVDEQANNFPYFMVVGYGSQSTGEVPADDLVGINMSVVGTYTDA